MIFRRIKAHIAKEDWLAVFIDFLIVVFGVFMGFQVNNWNDSRLREQTEQIYIERISEDLLANHDDMNQRLVYFEQTRIHALRALEALDQPPESLDLQFLVDVYQTSQIVPREFGRDTYDEVLSVGANSAIPELAVRKRIASFYSSIKAHLSLIEDSTPYREIVRRNMPYDAQVAIRAACDDVSGTQASGDPVIVLPETCSPELSPEAVSTAVMAIVQLDIRKDLVRRLSDLDAKINAAKVVESRVTLLEDYFTEIQP